MLEILVDDQYTRDGNKGGFNSPIVAIAVERIMKIKHMLECRLLMLLLSALVCLSNVTLGQDIETANTWQCRDLLDELRGGGQITGGPANFSAKDRQTFANQLDRWLTATKD